MTDIKRTTEFFNSLGINTFKVLPYDGGIALILEQGCHPKVVGYQGFLTAFLFDKDGNFIEMGAWE